MLGAFLSITIRHYGHAVGMILFIAIAGCSKSDESRIDDPPVNANAVDEPRSAAELLAAGKDPGVGKSAFGPTKTNTVEPDRNLDPSATPSTGAAVSGMTPIPGIVGADGQGANGQSANGQAASGQAVSPPGFKIAESGDAMVDLSGQPDVKERELNPNLSPKDLVNFLAQADNFMRSIYNGQSGITEQREAILEMNRTAKLKLVAARRLRDHVDADDDAKSEGARGELQALSHLAAQGDLKSAQELEALAKSNLESTDPRLVADSRIVLMGFAIEALQVGKKNAPDDLVALAKQITKNADTPDVPALMVMGQARNLLAQYGHEDQAVLVRQRIIDLFADSDDPQVARMAAEAAGNVRFDAIDKIRDLITKGESVAENRWREAANKLIDEAPDLVTVQYLAGAALEFEAIDQDGLVNATYEVMADRFKDSSQATGREVALASSAREARKAVIGRIFDPDLPTTDGSPMSIENFKGKIILMPFWAMRFPESLQVVDALKQLQQDHPDDVVIVGMNLDPSNAPLDEFLKQNDLGFRSYRSESSPTDTVPNQVAAKFGMVSMPFVAILDQETRITALDFTGHKLQATVDRLLAQ